MVETDRELADFFTNDHREIDTLWARVEEAAGAGKGDAAAASAVFDPFDRQMRRHLAWEEEVLFPAFEARTGMMGGPTEVMRMEHTQMRGVLDQMRRALGAGDVQELLDQGDTLLMLIQQHNQKEEGILYPMSEQVLGGEWNELKRRLG